MIIFFLNIITTHIIIFSFGTLLLNLLFKEKINKINLSETPLFGIIALSFFSLIINFFLPLNKIIGTIILICGLIYFFFIIKINRFLLKKIFKIIFITSLLSGLLLSYSNIYRPDAGLYHLPFTSLLNESNIILGSVNINFRFGITSIIQYLSAIQNNFLFDIKSIMIPIASIFSYTIYFLFQKSLKLRTKENVIQKILIFLICCFSLISFGRFSNYGNDAVSHLYYFILIVFILDNYKNIFLSNIVFNKISLISIFLFTTKPFMIMVIIFPFIIFFFHKNKKKICYNLNTFFINFFFIAWILRTIFISGCAVYPIEKTCLKNLYYYNDEQTIHEAKSGEAWAKDWINQKNNKLNFEEYNKNFNWISTWKNNHFKKIIEKLSPFFVFLIIIVVVFSFQKKNKRFKFPTELNFIFIASIILSILWFLKFPLYRYGLGFLSMSLMCIFVYFINIFKVIPIFDKLFTNFKIFFLICLIIFVSKNILRISNNIKNSTNDLWPDIYSEKNDYKINNFRQIIKNNEPLYFYSEGKLCMYSKSPCTNYNLKNLNKSFILNNQIYWRD
jgi:hypothetical protein